jgi:hypothetical protein
MGCLKNIIGLVILVLAIIGFFAIGGDRFVLDVIHNMTK